MMSLGSRINEIRREKKISIDDLSEKSGVPKGTLSKITAGITTSPTLDTVKAIARALGCRLDDLDDETITKNTPSDISEEARKIARSYDKMPPHGKGAVRAILNYEEKELSRYTQQKDDTGKIITLPKVQKNRDGFIEINVYDEPAAAGLGNYLDEPEYRVEQYPDHAIPSGTDFGVRIQGNSMEPRIHDGGTVFVRAMPAIDSGKIGVFVLDGKVYCKKLKIDHENGQVRLVSLNKEYPDILVGEFASLRTLGRVLGQWTPGQDNDDIFGW
jgi:repressor LexA